jgi:RNA polymerase sigma-70 factor (ECF subfamily)
MNHLEEFAAYRSYLFRLACRILGRVEDAEDLLQDTFLHWQQTSLANIRSSKAFLTTMLKNLCLNHLQSARLRREECVDWVFLEPLLAKTPGASSLPAAIPDSLTEAFLALFQRLSPKERVVFLLREVFDCEFEEISTIIKKNVANCRQILRRSRQHITSNRSRFTASPSQMERLVRQFLRTCKSGDLEGLISVLT